MTAARMLRAFGWMAWALPGTAMAQVPDMLTAFDAGGRAMGAGSSFYATGIDTLSATYNPAGLAYNSRRSFEISMRNYPKSNTRVTGSLTDLTLDTTTESGGNALGHMGAVFPIESASGQNRGAFSISWTVGGWFNDTQVGNNLSGGISGYRDFTRAKTNFVSLNYGKQMGDGSMAYGIGLVYAIQNVRNVQDKTFTDNNIPPEHNERDDTGNGAGVIAGMMFTPRNQSNMTIGASLRTPIRVRSNAQNLSLYDHIPGRFVLGASIANDGLRGGRDSMVYGAQLQYFFDGKDSDRLDRKNSYVAFGSGIEYGYAWGGGIVPIRIGYNWIPAGGDDFRQRSGFTYGIGYRPLSGDWSLELNFGRPSGGGNDSSILFGYRFGG